MKTCKMNVKPIRGSYSPECTNCGHRFETDHFKNSYEATCNIAMGEYTYCPKCGALYVGCQVEGKDFNKLDFDLKDWISARSSSLRDLYDRRVKDAKKLVKAAKEAEENGKQ